MISFVFWYSLLLLWENTGGKGKQEDGGSRLVCLKAITIVQMRFGVGLD